MNLILDCVVDCGLDCGLNWVYDCVLLFCLGPAPRRSLEALESYLRAGGNLSGDSDMAALAEVVRGLARSGRQEEVSATSTCSSFNTILYYK